MVIICGGIPGLLTKGFKSIDVLRADTRYSRPRRLITGLHRGQMKILTISYEYPPLGGGGGKVVQGLAKMLTARGHEMDVLTMAFRNLPKTEQNSGATIIRLPGIRRKTESCGVVEMLPHELLVLFRAARMIRKKRYDIIHAHFLFPDGFAARLLRSVFNIPVIVTAHGSDVPGYNPDRFKLLHILLNPIWRFTVRGVDLIASPSQHLVGLMQSAGSKAPTEVIPNGYDPDRYAPDREKIPRVLVVTRLFQRKGVQYIIEAVAAMEHPVELHIVGDGHYLDALKALAKERQVNVRFWGWLDNDSPELKELYETSLIFAFTSDQENFPINLLEAMCAGNAIITTNSSGTGEVVGDAAIQVPPQDPVAIRRALEHLLSHPDVAEDLGRKARERLESNFSWDVIADRYESAMHRLIAASERRRSDQSQG